jgi:3-hydroxyacyl-CoA dehydrogenase/3a,7a,12a-trihydroxy-5b-cholest-24-enoyl-CoA hydratase
LSKIIRYVIKCCLLVTGHVVSSKGVVLRSSIKDPVTLENVRDHWNAVTDMSSAEHRESIQVKAVSILSKIKMSQ